MVVKLRSVNPFSVGAVVAVMYVVSGLFVVVFFSLIRSMFGTMWSHGNWPWTAASAGGFDPGAWAAGIGILIFPLLYGMFGFIMGLIGALFYNLIALLTGGIEMNLSVRGNAVARQAAIGTESPPVLP